MLILKFGVLAALLLLMMFNSLERQSRMLHAPIVKRRPEEYILIRKPKRRLRSKPNTKFNQVFKS